MTKLAMLLAITLFSETMPWEAPYVKDGKGASSCDDVDGSGEKAGTGKSRNLVEKILNQSLTKGKELQKRKPRKDVPKRVPKQKPRIEGPVFSQSPIQMKKVKLRGKHEKPKNFVSEDEGDDGFGGGGKEDNLMRSCSFYSILYFHFIRKPDFMAELDALMEPSGNVVVEKENTWLGESQVSPKSKLTVD